jgi:Helix-hairpin-helix motif
MVKYTLIALTSLLLACHTHALGQSDTLDNYIERLIESYAESNADDNQFDFSQNFENLDDIKKHPLDVNDVTEEQLSNLFFLNAIQRQAIIQHRQKYGAYIALEELQSIDVLDNDVIKILQYFLTLTPQPTNVFKFNNMFKAPKQTLFLKFKNVLQTRKGYIADTLGSTAYKGDPHHMFVRYKMESNNNFKMGFTAEKDPGESFFSASNKKGFDFYSGFAFIQNISRTIKTIALGDYTLSFGQGLVLHNDFGAGKSSYVMNIKKSGRTLRPYSSVNESNYFRGIAITTLPYRNVELTLLYSFKKVDGSIQADTLDLDIEQQATAILRSGYHRTASEIANQNNLSQTNYGGSLVYKMQKLHLGLHHLNYTFSKNFNKADQLYNLYAFSGTSLSNTGIDYNCSFRNATLFGEIAMSNNGGLAQVHGLLMPLDRHIDVSVCYRNYQKNYQVLEANAFGEGSQPINEKGIYFGMEARPTNAWKISS